MHNNPSKLYDLKRPCDCCKRRRIRCNRQDPCNRCQVSGLKCTYLVPSKKRGPKVRPHNVATTAAAKGDNTHQYQNQNIQELPGKFDKDIVDQVLKIYWGRQYPVWPLFNYDELHELLVNNEYDTNHKVYILIISLCAATLAITKDKVVGSNTSSSNSSSSTIGTNSGQYSGVVFTSTDFGAEVQRYRSYYDVYDNCDFYSIMAAYCYQKYWSTSGDDGRGMLLLRESISMLQLCGMHLEDSYKPPSRLNDIKRRLFYLIFMNERYYCVRYGYPVVLDQTIDLPVNNETGENAQHIDDFLQLVETFLTPKKWRQKQLTFGKSGSDYFDNLRNKLDMPLNLSTSKLEFTADIIVSKHWMRTLAWDQHRMKWGRDYPADVGREMLCGISSKPIEHMKVHVPGIEYKLFKVADSLKKTISPKSTAQSPLDSLYKAEIVWGISNIISKLVEVHEPSKMLMQELLMTLNETTSLPLAISTYKSSPGNIEEVEEETFRATREDSDEDIDENHDCGTDYSSYSEYEIGASPHDMSPHDMSSQDMAVYLE